MSILGFKLRRNPANYFNSGFINSLIYGRSDYQPKAREYLKQFGNAKIISMEVRRTPLSQILMGILDVASFGQISKNNPYDKLFHLALAVKLDTGDILLIEKNEVINMELNPYDKPNTEAIDNTLNRNITLNNLMNNTRNRMGQDFFTYSARNNNCQDFILNILQANGLDYDQKVVDFVKQDTVKVFGDMTRFRKLSNTITDIAGRFNVLTEGNGLSTKNGLTDTDLNDLLKNVSNFEGVYSKDLLPKKLKNNSWYIINMQDSDDGNGTHWTCFKTGKVLEYYDSFGFPPPLEVMEKHIKGGIDWSPKQIQNKNSTACGYFCVARITSNIPFQQFIDYFSYNTHVNDILLKQFLEWNGIDTDLVVK